MDRIAMEWGYKACERGLNIQAALLEFDELTKTEAAQPVWRSDRYTEEDANNLFGMIEEEVRDSIKETTEEWCDRMGQPEVDGYLVNLELLMPYHKLQNPPDGMTTEELLTEISEEPEEDHKDLLRFGMLVEDETVIGGYRITDHGINVLQEWF